MNPLESFELVSENNIVLESSSNIPLMEFSIAEPSGKILYVDKSKVFELYKKNISLKEKGYRDLLPISLDIEKISFEKLAYNLVIENDIYDISNLYELRDNILNKSIDEQSEIYINMPICTHGKIIKKPFLKKTMLVNNLENNKKYEVNILIQNFSIEKEKMFIEKNEIFILGTVASLEKTISIDVGAILI